MFEIMNNFNFDKHRFWVVCVQKLFENMETKEFEHSMIDYDQSCEFEFSRSSKNLISFKRSKDVSAGENHAAKVYADEIRDHRN